MKPSEEPSFLVKGCLVKANAFMKGFLPNLLPENMEMTLSFDNSSPYLCPFVHILHLIPSTLILRALP